MLRACRLHLPSLYKLPATVEKRSMTQMATKAIQLNEQEHQLARLLVECARWIDANPSEVDALRLRDANGEWIGRERTNEPVELRMAGGWVRDKLLGVDSSDIDVATAPDPITGLKFATLLEKYLELNGKRDLMGKLTKIEAKPEQSKHLETATALVCGLSVDWVQMRGNEVYTANSRIPTVEFGTALQDAERRDLTINALFYNLRTGEIEDQTGKGLADLGLMPGQPKRIRTPLDPFQTFSDDPLRVVRSVRFAARFGREFELDPQLVNAVQRDEIRAALRDPKKISRERVGIELEKMLLGKDPFLAVELIQRLNLHELVFLYDHNEVYSYRQPNSAAAEPDVSIALTAATIVQSLLSGSHSHPLHPILSPQDTARLPLDKVAIKRLYLSACLLPLYDLYILEKTKPVWVGEKVIRETIKWPTHERIWATKARDAATSLSAYVAQYEGMKGEARPGERSEIGVLLRGLNAHDGHQTPWNQFLLWALVYDLTLAHPDESAMQAVIDRYNAFATRIVELDLDTRSFAPPLLDGGEVIAAVPETKGSPATSLIIALVIRYQLDHPDASKDDARAFLTGEGRAEVDKLLEQGRALLMTAKAGKSKKGGKKQAS